MSVRPAYRLTLSRFVLIGFSAALVLRMVYVQKWLTRPIGRLTAQQVIEKSKPFCREIVPEIDPIAIYVTSSEGPFGNCWDVSCRDKAGKDVLNLTWDADTAELCMVGVEIERPPKQGKRLNPREATQAARHWLEALGFAAKSPSWHLLHPPFYKNNQAVAVEWHGVGHQAYIHLDAYSGELQYAQMWHGRRPDN